MLLVNYTNVMTQVLKNMANYHKIYKTTSVLINIKYCATNQHRLGENTVPCTIPCHDLKKLLLCYL